MRISKTNYLKRLLQIQDVCLTALFYVVALDASMFVGWLTASETAALVQLTPIVLMLAIVATMSYVPQLRGLTDPWFALRHSGLMTAGVVVVLYLANGNISAKPTIITFAVLLGGGLLANRMFLRWWYLTRKRPSRASLLKVLVVGAGSRARTLMSRYRTDSDWTVDILGIIDPDPEFHGKTVDGVKVVGGLERACELLSRHPIDEVVVCLPRRMLGDLGPVADACADEGVCLKFLADLTDVRSGPVSLDLMGSLPILSFEPVPRDETSLIIKRIMDLFLTMLVIPLLAPVFLLVAIAIKLDSKGAVFFLQDRVGLHKRRFKMIKFRSMSEDAEQRLQEVEHLNEAQGPIFKIRDDPRVTRVGRLLRRTSIDELPQLLNVLAGHMSLIGPRPMSVRDVERFSHSIQRRRFGVRPGLLCLREVSGRSRLSFDQWLELDLRYIEEWSLLLDLKILVRAIPSVIRGDGAS